MNSLPFSGAYLLLHIIFGSLPLPYFLLWITESDLSLSLSARFIPAISQALHFFFFTFFFFPHESSEQVSNWIERLPFAISPVWKRGKKAKKKNWRRSCSSRKQEHEEVPMLSRSVFIKCIYSTVFRTAPRLAKSRRHGNDSEGSQAWFFGLL